MNQQKILDRFQKEFGIPEIVAFAPGRANIIGEHTDYNQGFVFPFAIDKKIMYCSSVSATGQFNLIAYDLNESLTFKKGDRIDKGYGRFFSSVVEVMIEEGYKVEPLNICFGGNLAIGAGISSSSAITCGFLGLVNEHFELKLSKKEILRLAVRAEHGVGVQGGAMDQFSIINGEKGKALLMDCLTNEVELVKVDLSPFSFYLLNSNVSHNLQDTEYNTRSKTCKTSFEKIKSQYKEVKTFRDVTGEHLGILDEVQHKRLTHVLQENERVARAVKAIKEKDVAELGELLNKSHVSLRDLYEVSCEELDFIEEVSNSFEAVAGCRMMGGGFGGSAICLMDQSAAPNILPQIASAYKAKFNRELDCFRIQPEAGLKVMTYQNYIN